MAHHILSMDGGNGGATGIFLSELEKWAGSEGVEFLRRVDLFAGTSAGAVNALLFARHDDPVEAFETVFRFDEQVRRGALAGENFWGLAAAFKGDKAILSLDLARRFLVEAFGEDMRLGDLKHRVLVTTVRLDNGAREHERQWQPIAYSNEPDGHWLDERVVDVALRAMAMPIHYPMYQGLDGTGPAHVDGGVAANNPSMTALAHALLGHPLGDMALLSVGCRRNLVGGARHLAPETREGKADWGYNAWLLDVWNPLLLVDLFLQAGAEAVHQQCWTLLRERYHRAVPPDLTGADWNETHVDDLVDRAVLWLDRVGWAVA